MVKLDQQSKTHKLCCLDDRSTSTSDFILFVNITGVFLVEDKLVEISAGYNNDAIHFGSAVMVVIVAISTRGGDSLRHCVYSSDHAPDCHLVKRSCKQAITGSNPSEVRTSLAYNKTMRSITYNYYAKLLII